MALLLRRMPALGGLPVASTVNGSGRCLPLDGQRTCTIEETPLFNRGNSKACQLDAIAERRFPLIQPRPTRLYRQRSLYSFQEPVPPGGRIRHRPGA